MAWPPGRHLRVLSKLFSGYETVAYPCQLTVDFKFKLFANVSVNTTKTTLTLASTERLHSIEVKLNIYPTEIHSSIHIYWKLAFLAFLVQSSSPFNLKYSTKPDNNNCLTVCSSRRTWTKPNYTINEWDSVCYFVIL